MKTRVVAGLIGAIGLILLVFKGPLWGMLIAVLAGAGIAYMEFDRLFFTSTSKFRVARMISVIMLSIVALYLSQLGWILSWICIAFLAGVHLWRAQEYEDFKQSVKDFSIELFGFIYINLLFSFLMPIVSLSNSGRQNLFLLFGIVFWGDTAAYFVGSFFGRHKLTHISPKKSIEGAIAAVVVSCLMCYLWALFAPISDAERAMSLKITLFAPIGSCLAQLGDLFESLLKRSRLQKDSGSFLPGHGGILDRIDGLAFISPIYYAFLIFVFGVQV